MNNPYKGSPATSRVNVDISTEDFNFIRAIRPKSGTVQGTVNNLWYKLVNKLKERGITSYDRESDFVDFVQRCEIVLPEDLDNRRGAAGGSAAKTENGNDRKRTKRVRAGGANAAGKLATL